MAGTPARAGAGSRFARLLGGFSAFLLTAGLVVCMVYAYGHLDELQHTVAALDGEADGASDLSRAADNAIGFVEGMAAPPPSNNVGRGYAFTHSAPTGVDDDPAHWCAAGDIGYRIDFTASRSAGSTPAKEKARWKEAFDQWTDASGGRYTFSYLGPAEYPLTNATTATYPIDPDLVPEGEIAISYGVPPAERASIWDGYRHPALTDALGVAAVGPFSWSSGPEQGQVTRGLIVLDAIDSELDPRSLPVPYVHEAGHALGLGHVSDPGQIMYDTAGVTSRINSGDRAGITRLASLPCG